MSEQHKSGGSRFLTVTKLTKQVSQLETRVDDLEPIVHDLEANLDESVEELLADIRKEEGHLPLDQLSLKVTDHEVRIKKLEGAKRAPGRPRGQKDTVKRKPKNP